jgi:hypothetical protein
MLKVCARIFYRFKEPSEGSFGCYDVGCLVVFLFNAGLYVGDFSYAMLSIWGSLSYLWPSPEAPYWGGGSASSKGMSGVASLFTSALPVVSDVLLYVMSACDLTLSTCVRSCLMSLALSS